jgi:hypothetical protein
MMVPAEEMKNYIGEEVGVSDWKHAMIMEGVYIRYSHGSYGKINEKEIELFKQSTLMFAKKAANRNLLKEII